MDWRNNFIWNLAVFHVFLNWSVFLLLVLVKSFWWELELIEPEVRPGRLLWVLNSAKVHKHQWFWNCENGVVICDDFLWWKLYFRTVVVPFKFQWRQYSGLSFFHIPWFCRLKLKYISITIKNVPQYSVHCSSMYSVLRKEFKNRALKGILGLIGDSVNESTENRRGESAVWVMYKLWWFSPRIFLKIDLTFLNFLCTVPPRVESYFFLISWGIF